MGVFFVAALTKAVLWPAALMKKPPGWEGKLSLNRLIASSSLLAAVV